MPFLIIGIIILILGIIFYRHAKKSGDSDGVVGSSGLIIAGLILIIIFGFFYRGLTLLGS
ncbi:hypothetical protein KJ611_02265 [Patescibacteria group bacterium]|nr:hypothetical protein [Patescibacteria group bacterium]MBU1705520.1 hypothetical protein [Patescibacteria group bacterium]